MTSVELKVFAFSALTSTYNVGIEVSSEVNTDDKEVDNYQPELVEGVKVAYSKPAPTGDAEAAVSIYNITV